MQGKLAVVGDLLADCASRPVWSLSDSELVDSLDALHMLAAQTAALQLAIVHELDGRAIPVAQGASSSAVWLRERLRISHRTAKQTVDLARALARHDLTATALSSGAINTEQADVIVQAIDPLPNVAGPDVRDKAEATLVEFATQFEPGSLRKLGAQILSHIAPEIAEQAEAEAWERSERRAREGRGFAMTVHPSGRVRVTGWLEPEAAAIIAAALDPLTAPGALPRYHHRTNSTTATTDSKPHNATPGPSGATTTDTIASDTTATGTATTDTAASGTAASGTAASGTTAAGTTAAGSGLAAFVGAASGTTTSGAVDDDRTPTQRRADALVEVCRLVLNTGQLPENGGDRPQLVVTIDYSKLAAQTGRGMLDNGQSLAPSTVRRIACDAEIIPAVLGGQGQVLDVGRSRRLFTGPLRQALVIRDRGCTFPGCDRPPRWTDGHHIRSWLDGGPTDLSNAVLVCQYHHTTVHKGEWQVRIAPDGLPVWTPPFYVDPLQKPQRNTYWRTKGNQAS